MTNMIHCGWSFGALLALVTLVGCQGSSTAKVEGTVKYQGQAVPRGTVIIQDEAGAIHQANLMPDGTFHVVGVGLGNALVAVQVPQHLLDQAAAAESMTEAKNAQASADESLREDEVPSGFVMPIPIPKKYSNVSSSGLQYELTSDRRSWQLEIELQ